MSKFNLQQQVKLNWQKAIFLLGLLAKLQRRQNTTDFLVSAFFMHKFFFICLLFIFYVYFVKSKKICGAVK